MNYLPNAKDLRIGHVANLTVESIESGNFQLQLACLRMQVNHTVTGLLFVASAGPIVRFVNLFTYRNGAFYRYDTEVIAAMIEELEGQGYFVQYDAGDSALAVAVDKEAFSWQTKQGA